MMLKVSAVVSVIALSMGAGYGYVQSVGHGCPYTAADKLMSLGGLLEEEPIQTASWKTSSAGNPSYCCPADAPGKTMTTEPTQVASIFDTLLAEKEVGWIVADPMVRETQQHFATVFTTDFTTDAISTQSSASAVSGDPAEIELMPVSLIGAPTVAEPMAVCPVTGGEKLAGKSDCGPCASPCDMMTDEPTVSEPASTVAVAATVSE